MLWVYSARSPSAIARRKKRPRMGKPCEQRKKTDEEISNTPFPSPFPSPPNSHSAVPDDDQSKGSPFSGPPDEALSFAPRRKRRTTSRTSFPPKSPNTIRYGDRRQEGSRQNGPNSPDQEREKKGYKRRPRPRHCQVGRDSRERRITCQVLRGRAAELCTLPQVLKVSLVACVPL